MIQHQHKKERYSNPLFFSSLIHLFLCGRRRAFVHHQVRSGSKMLCLRRIVLARWPAKATCLVKRLIMLWPRRGEKVRRLYTCGSWNWPHFCRHKWRRWEWEIGKPLRRWELREWRWAWDSLSRSKWLCKRKMRKQYGRQRHQVGVIIQMEKSVTYYGPFS